MNPQIEPLTKRTLCSQETALLASMPLCLVMFFVPVKGNKEQLGDLTRTFPPWIATTNGKDYGYSKMTVMNATHLLWEQISATEVRVFCGNACLIQDMYVCWLGVFIGLHLS